MPKFNSIAFLEEMESNIEQLETKLENLLAVNEYAQLKQIPAKNKWSALECIEHLNMTGRYYLPKIENVLNTAITKGIEPKDLFKTGIMGNYMYKSMKPQDGSIKNKVTTFKSVDPQRKYAISTLDPSRVITNFKQQLSQLKDLIKMAKQTDINKLKIPSLVGPILMFKLGDVFRFLLAHMERHLIQATHAIPEKVA